MTSEHRVTILWGAEPEDNEPIGYEFSSREELVAFLSGVDESSGWLDYEIVEDAD